MFSMIAPRNNAPVLDSRSRPGFAVSGLSRALAFPLFPPNGSRRAAIGDRNPTPQRGQNPSARAMPANRTPRESPLPNRVASSVPNAQHYKGRFSACTPGNPMQFKGNTTANVFGDDSQVIGHKSFLIICHIKSEASGSDQLWKLGGCAPPVLESF